MDGLLMQNHIFKLMIWGVPIFSETSIDICVYKYIQIKQTNKKQSKDNHLIRKTPSSKMQSKFSKKEEKGYPCYCGYPKNWSEVVSPEPCSAPKSRHKAFWGEIGEANRESAVPKDVPNVDQRTLSIDFQL